MRCKGGYVIIACFLAKPLNVCYASVAGSTFLLCALTWLRRVWDAARQPDLQDPAWLACWEVQQV